MDATAGHRVGLLASVLLVAQMVWVVGCASTRNESLSSEKEATRAAPSARVEVSRARHGMVVAGHPAAAEVGVEVLQAGGSAMDAAVAVSLALGVAEPYGSGLGGKLMLLYFDAASTRTHAVDAMDEASATLDVEAFLARDAEERREGWGAVAVPGLLAGLYEGHRRWGRRPWAEVVGPAVELARDGAEVLPGTRSLFERRVEKIESSIGMRDLFMPGGQLPEVGGTLRNMDLARTLEAIAGAGRDGFYSGPVADRIVEASRERGGTLTADDLAHYEARVIEPLSLDGRGFTLVSAPPPASGGATLLAAWAGLLNTPWGGGGLMHPENLDRMGRSLQRIYPKVQARIADVPTARAAFERLIAEALPHSQVGAADKAYTGHKSAGRRTEMASTTHFVVADAAGNVASVTQSLSHHFGAGVVAPGTGVVFNNTMKNFATRDPESVNFVAAGKRPRSTIAPTLVLRDGKPALAIGIPGGQRIPTATLQVLLDHLLFDADLEEAIGKPRVHLRRPLRGDAPTNVFELEAAAGGLGKALRKRDWAVEVNEDDEAFGGFCAIEIRGDGSLVGFADQRRTNAARGY